MFRCHLLDSTWYSNFTYSTEEYKSNDKYFFAKGDSLVLVSYVINVNGHSLDIYSIDKESLALKIMKKGISITEDLGNIVRSHSVLDNNRLIILVPPSKKIIIVNLNSFSVQYINNSPALSIYSSSVSYAVISGKIGRSEYLYYYNFKKFFRFDLDLFTFTEIPVPKFVTARMSNIWERGGIVSNLFCFWPTDSPFTFCYDVNKNVWLIDRKNPFYQKWYLPLDYTFEESFSYYQNGTVMKRISIK